jgi:hypothetical protein
VSGAVSPNREQVSDPRRILGKIAFACTLFDQDGMWVSRHVSSWSAAGIALNCPVP